MTHLKATSFQDYANKKKEEEDAKKLNQGILNEEQEAQARKESGGFFHPIYECHPTDEPQKIIFVEAERWFDARAFAIRQFGVSEVKAKLVETSLRPLPRFQIKWVGTAASGTSDPLRLQKRELKKNMKSVPRWADYA